MIIAIETKNINQLKLGLVPLVIILKSSKKIETKKLDSFDLY